MPLKLEIKKKLSSRSERVKCIEFHPTYPWVLSGLYSGNILIHDYITQAVLKSFEVSNAPVRCAQFVLRKHWLIVGSDDKVIRVYNYNTLEKVKSFVAHEDYIRSLIVHPTLPYALSSSDDCVIKLWDWDKNWEQKKTYEGHSHYVMQIDFNPKDYSTFASASLDRTIKVWGLTGSESPHFTLTGHSQGLNCLNYYPGGDKPYLASGGDDMKIKVWDYQTKQCLVTLDGHHHNVSSVAFHPDLPLLISTSEDSTVKLWHSTTFRIESTLNYSMDRAWAQSTVPGTKLLALGFDEGNVVVKLGSDEPLASMTSTGFVLWVKNNEIFSANARVNEEEICDGEPVVLVPKETETCEFYPQYIQHSPSGRSFALCGDGDYVVKSTRAFRNQGYGTAQEFCWLHGTSDFAVKSGNSIKVLRDSEEKLNYKAPYSVEGIFGGFLLGVKSEDFIDFVDWATGALVRRINISPKAVYWSDSGQYVALVQEDNFFILKYNSDYDKAAEPDEEGIESSFDLEYEIIENLVSGLWISDCFFFVNATHKLNYSLSGKSLQMVNLDKKYYILGYIPEQSRIYLIDTSHNVISYAVTLSFIEYQIAVVNEDFGKAETVFPGIPVNFHTKCAKFLDTQGYKEEAMAITQDIDHKFELAVQLNFLTEAYEIAKTEQNNETRWKTVGDLALLSGDMDLAEDCLTQAGDFNGLLLLYTSIGVPEKLRALGELAFAHEKFNTAFMSFFMLHDGDKCIETLVKSGRIPEAAFFAKCYVPSRVPDIMKLWREDLKAASPITAQALCDPTEYPQKFPEYTFAMDAEKALQKFYSEEGDASEFLKRMGLFGINLLELAKEDPRVDLRLVLEEAPECPDDPIGNSN